AAEGAARDPVAGEDHVLQPDEVVQVRRPRRPNPCGVRMMLGQGTGHGGENDPRGRRPKPVPEGGPWGGAGRQEMLDYNIELVPRTGRSCRITTTLRALIRSGCRPRSCVSPPGNAWWPSW